MKGEQMSPLAKWGALHQHIQNIRISPLVGLSFPAIVPFVPSCMLSQIMSSGRLKMKVVGPMPNMIISLLLVYLKVLVRCQPSRMLVPF